MLKRREDHKSQIDKKARGRFDSDPALCAGALLFGYPSRLRPTETNARITPTMDSPPSRPLATTRPCSWKAASLEAFSSSEDRQRRRGVRPTCRRRA